MLRFYTPILILQLLCLYFAYKRNEEQKWFWLIIIFPLFGSLIYLFDTFYSKKKIETLAEQVTNGLKSNSKIKQLEKQLDFSDTVATRIRLGDEYFKIGEYQKAADLLESCVHGIYKNDSGLVRKLIQANFELKNYTSVIEYGEKILGDIAFKNSDEKVALAWAYFREGNTERADILFQELDSRFTNYEQRLEYALYLKESGRGKQAKNKLHQLLTEIESMEGEERKWKRSIYNYIKNEHASIHKQTN